MKLLQYEIKVMETMLKRFHRIATVDEIQFCFMSERGTIDAVFILKKLQEEHCVKGTSFIYA